MRTLGTILIAGGMLCFIFELVSPGLLPSVIGSPALAVLALGVGVVLVWLGELGRQRRHWKGVKNAPKKYYD